MVCMEVVDVLKAETVISFMYSKILAMNFGKLIVLIDIMKVTLTTELETHQKGHL